MQEYVSYGRARDFYARELILTLCNPRLVVGNPGQSAVII